MFYPEYAYAIIVFSAFALVHLYYIRFRDITIGLEMKLLSGVVEFFLIWVFLALHPETEIYTRPFVVMGGFFFTLFSVRWVLHDSIINLGRGLGLNYLGDPLRRSRSDRFLFWIQYNTFSPPWLTRILSLSVSLGIFYLITENF